MAISSLNPVKFTEDALSCTGPLALSYDDPDQKWIIRQHLVALFRNYPFLRPSVGVFTHNDGTEVKLLNANGDLPVSKLAPPVPVTIWIHEIYPHTAPIVYVNATNPGYPIYHNHPFVDRSGTTGSSYLSNWQFSKCNLCDLVRNLIKLFSHNHPFYYSGDPAQTHPSMVSKMEAMDRVVNMVHYDVAAIKAKSEEDIENLTTVQAELRKRADAVSVMVHGLGVEKRRLKGRINQLCDESDKVLNWLKVYDHKGSVCMEDYGFEALDGRSEMIMECLAADYAVEDVMYALDRAVEEGVLSFEAYIKQVRVLAREQFLHRAKVVRLERPKSFSFV